MDSDLIVLPRAAVESLRKHLEQECEASGTIEGGCIAANALNRVEDLLAAAKGVVMREEVMVRELLYGKGLVVRWPPSPTDAIGCARAGTYNALLIAADAAEEGE